LKRLYVFCLRSFTGPLVVTFLISMFILVMQFLWKYIDDLLGKGISVWVLLKLLFFVSASLIPLALPLAMLLASIMTFGNLAENNELTALKSSGFSLYKIMKPYTAMVIFITCGTFYFANYVIPVANLKWHSLIYDIQNTKISAIITPGVYSKELEGYAIKVDEEVNNSFKGIKIHDNTNPNEVKTIRAKTGKIYKSSNGKYLFFELNNGVETVELNPQPPSFLPNGKLIPNPANTHPSRETKFLKSTIKMDLSGFNLSLSDQNLFKNKYEMLNVFQIQYALDSVQLKARDILTNFTKNIKFDHIYYVARNFKLENGSEKNLKPNNFIGKDLITTDSIQGDYRIRALESIQTHIRRKNDNLKNQGDFIETFNRELVQYFIEFHRKFALTYAILILFFVGAPLGAIVRKGGFGAPVVIAALIFMIYFVMITIGENLAVSGVLSPFAGMWGASMILTPLALLFMRSAANDSPVFNKDLYIRLWRKLRGQA
jgi:lipopolysaccharide export system permease protein